jgi:hypothetical protein
MDTFAPYRDRSIALATMHAKDRAIAKPFKLLLGAEVIVADGIDTDTFGTFIGEITRQGTMLEAALAKASTAINITKLPFGLGSEGSFGPHPSLPFIAGGVEILAFEDRERDFKVHETLVTNRTNFSSRTCTPKDDLSGFLSRIDFPKHAVVVMPSKTPTYDFANP